MTAYTIVLFFNNFLLPIFFLNSLFQSKLKKNLKSNPTKKY
jgi:hypothetical protein